MYSQKISVKIRMRSRKGAVNGNIYLQVIIDGLPIKIPLGVTWPVDKFDMKEESLIPRYDKDEDCYKYNLMMENEKSKANKLVLRYYAAERHITPDQFKASLKAYSSTEDVIETFRALGDQLLAEKLITSGTRRNYTTHFNRIDKYLGNKRWKFRTVSKLDILKLEAWLRDNFSHNTIAGAMRVLHKFFSQCMDEGMIIETPFKGYKMPDFVEGVRDVLEPDELKILTEFYTEGQMTDLEKDCLRRYLVSCYTGLRKSDVEQLDPRFHIRNNNVLRLHMFKTRRYGKSVEFNLSDIASKLIGKKRERLFPPIESALLGKTLRRVIWRAGIDKYLKFHSGRDTFATVYLELGGNIVDLQEILGHANIKTTMIYIRMGSRTKNDIMSKFDNLLAPAS